MRKDLKKLIIDMDNNYLGIRGSSTMKAVGKKPMVFRRNGKLSPKLEADMGGIDPSKGKIAGPKGYRDKE